MRWRRLPAGILLPALLVGLVGVLAALQYRWLGQVSEAEREQLGRSLTQRARELTDEFDREVTRLFLAMQGARDAVSGLDGPALGSAFDRWRGSARYPQMVRGLYVADWSGAHLQIRRFDPGSKSFDAAPLTAWPAHLEPVRQLLNAQGAPPGAEPPPHPAARGGNVQFVAFSLSPVVQEVPALVIPLASPFPAVSGPAAGSTSSGTAASGTTTFRWVEQLRASMVVDLDREYLARSVLAGLAERHFPGDAAGGYRLAVVDAAGTALFQRGFAAGVAIDVQRADIAMPFFGLRVDLLAESMGVAGPKSSSQDAPPGQAAQPVNQLTIVQRQGDPAGGAPVDPTRGLPAPSRVAITVNTTAAARSGEGVAIVRGRLLPGASSWRLVLQHGAGSLDAAVSQARARNLWLSFGILGVLATGVVLVMANARRSQQLAAKQMDFVATVSHELRTPLAVIRSAAQNLAAGVVAEPAQARRYGTLIEDEGRRLTDMVEQVMDYAGLEGRGRVREPRPVDVPALVEQVAMACRATCEAAGCALVVDTTMPEDGGSLSVMGDEAALGRVVTNLITNAAKHGAEGQWVGVKVSSCAVKGGHEVLITVSDRGRGIDASDLAHVFEPFRRGRHALEQQVHGNGLGLSLVKRIVEAHGGRVAVTSAHGQGATFVVYLPACAGATASGDVQ